MSLVSVVIPMRNAERYVKATLESVLAQDGVDLEVVVVDDGSTDHSADIVRAIAERRIRMIAGPQKGIAAAFNAGLAAARGQIFARCDADDLYPPGRLAWQVDFLDRNPDFGAVCGAFATMADNGSIVTERTVGLAGEEVTAELRGGVGRSHLCAYAIRTEILRQLGGCRTYFPMAEDADLQYRLAESTRIWYEPRPSYLYRLHDASITHSRGDAERVFFDEQARRFQRQRLAGGLDDIQRGCPPQPPDPKALKASDGAGPTTSRKHIQALLLGAAWNHHRGGRKAKALWTGLRACWAAPTIPAGWRSLVALAVKRAGSALS
jgi:glycosyltransferase involved in cell wall biosynthesis